MSLTCKKMLIVNDLFYKRSSLWWFLYEHISGLSSALLNHLHTGNWRWEYYSHVRPHYSVCKAQRHNWVSGTFNCNCSSTCRAIRDCTTSCQLFNKWGQICHPNRESDFCFYCHVAPACTEGYSWHWLPCFQSYFFELLDTSSSSLTMSVRITKALREEADCRFAVSLRKRY